MATYTRAWLYVRGGQTVRMVMDRGTLAVYGPGDLFRHHSHGDDAAAILEQSLLEQQLVGDGWSLEQMTTERRAGADRRQRVRGDDRRRSLRLVDENSTDTR